MGAAALPLGHTPPPKNAPGDSADEAHEAYLRWLWWDWRWRWYLSLTQSSYWARPGTAEHLHV